MSTIRFGAFAIDFDTRQLTRDSSEVHLAPKAFDLLMALILERPKVLSKAALQERLWPDTFVVEGNLSNLIAELREALGDAAQAPRYIRTSYGVGYAFCADAIDDPLTAGDHRTTNPSCWLQWGRRRFPLVQGTHIIGRDEDVDVRLDHSTVSRRHARLVVTPEQTTLEDFDSKNGTLCGSQRVTTPVALADGAAIRIGSLLLTFHHRARLGSTETAAVPRDVVID